MVIAGTINADAIPLNQTTATTAKVTVHKAAAKRKTWKKPQDKPKRPLSAYNLFFRAQRERIVQPGSITTDASTKRKNRNTHGKVGFESLAKTIAVKWKSLDAESRRPFTEQAAKEKVKYDMAIDNWNAARLGRPSLEHILDMAYGISNMTSQQAPAMQHQKAPAVPVPQRHAPAMQQRQAPAVPQRQAPAMHQRQVPAMHQRQAPIPDPVQSIMKSTTKLPTMPAMVLPPDDLFCSATPDEVISGLANLTPDNIDFSNPQDFFDNTPIPYMPTSMVTPSDQGIDYLSRLDD